MSCTKCDFSHSAPFRSFSYVLLVTSLMGAILAVPINLHLALLPVALVSGWCQIGGL